MAGATTRTATRAGAERLVLEGELRVVAQQPGPGGAGPAAYELRVDDEPLLAAITEQFPCGAEGAWGDSCGRVRIIVERAPPIPAD
jgi:hypothetical protein